ncbi:MAG: iron ABC transporter permease [Clostridia bacterium]
MNVEKRNLRVISLFLLAGLLLVVAFVLNVIIGSAGISLSDIWGTITGSDEVSDTTKKIILGLRLPRTLAAILSGACLATSGVLLQIFFNNPIVEPYILGVSSGSNLFVGLVMLAGFNFGMESISSFGMFVGSFIGAMVIMLCVIIASQKVKSITTLLIVGMMFSYVCSAVTSFITTLADKEKLTNFTLWSMGSFSGFLWDDVILLAQISLPFLFCAWIISKQLNIMILGEKYAQSMGVSIKTFRFLIVFISSVLTAVVTAFAGPVSFVGLAVPHIIRILFKTSNNKIVIPAACLFGAVMTAFCDLCTRTLLSPYEIPLSAITSIIGAPILVFLLLRRKENQF